MSLIGRREFLKRMAFAAVASGLLGSELFSRREAIDNIICFNVLDYGAVGDGLNDDGPALRAAIEDAKNHIFIYGGQAEIRLPFGTYSVGKDPFEISGMKGITIRGEYPR